MSLMVTLFIRKYMNENMDDSQINRDEVVEDKQCVCDMCWYLWIRCVGKRCPFKSGTIFLEDVNYKVFNAISRLGYSRVLLRSVVDAFQYDS